ncbi:MAG: hypothetical protein QG646_2385 [Euryarchaeota archaeon]|nr:hypothetical protein [Euryarchaeota archaeon]
MEDPVITIIKRHFDMKGNPARIPVMKGKKLFTARLEEDGIYVDNLGDQPFLPWQVFTEAINCLKENGGQVKKGNAADSKLGDPNLDLNTMEGYIASKIYGCKTGDSVFTRIDPIASILAWTEICENTRGHVRFLQGIEELGIEELNTSKDEEKVPLVTSIGGIIENYKIENSEIENSEIENSEKTELEQEVLQNNTEITNLHFDLAQRDEALKNQENLLDQRGETIRFFENVIKEKDLEVKTLQDKLKVQLSEIEGFESKLVKRIEDISTLEGRLAKKEEDLRILAEKYITMDSEIRKVEEKLVGREKRINNLEISLATSETKVKQLGKQLSDYKEDENLAIQLREKEELIKQLKGTLASKEEEFTRLTEENRKYKRQQKFESEGLKQIEEQKTAKKWWKNW